MSANGKRTPWLALAGVLGGSVALASAGHYSFPAESLDWVISHGLVGGALMSVVALAAVIGVLWRRDEAKDAKIAQLEAERLKDRADDLREQKQLLREQLALARERGEEQAVTRATLQEATVALREATELLRRLHGNAPGSGGAEEHAP